MEATPSRTVTARQEVEASAELVWSLISDLPGMGALSPENAGGRWLDGAAGPQVGVRFRGQNRRNGRRWSTVATVTRCEPGRAFTFDVSSLGLPVATWAYEITPTPAGCEVSETWRDRRGALMALLGRLVTGVADRERHTAEGIEQTLAALRARAEGRPESTAAG